MPVFQPALVSITFRKLSPAEIVAAVRDTPLLGIEWGGDVHVPHGDLKTAAEVGRMTRDAGLEPYCYGSYYRFREVAPDGKEPGPDIEAVLDTAVALGAPRVRVWAGEMDFENAEAGYLSAVAARAHEVAALAQARGLAIDLEFHGGTLNNSAEHSLELLEMIAHPNVHTLWQAAVPLTVDQRVKGLEKLLTRVSNIHCFHWGPGGWKDRHALAEGAEAWKAYLDVFRKVATPRWIALEYVQDDALEALARDSRTLAEWLKQ